MSAPGPIYVQVTPARLLRALTPAQARTLLAHEKYAACMDDRSDEPDWPSEADRADAFAALAEIALGDTLPGTARLSPHALECHLHYGGPCNCGVGVVTP